MILEGQVCFITGGGRGIGKAIALKFAEKGANIVTIARTRSEIEGTIQKIKKMGRKGLAVVGDISKEEDVKKSVSKIIEEFGKIDIVINNAGIAPKSSRVSIEKTTTEDWDTILDVNLRGTFLVTKEVLKHMKNNNKGYIINISSVAGKKALSGESCAYHASKFGLIGFTEVLRKSLMHSGISVSVICPGRVFTGMGETIDKDNFVSYKWIKPEDIANVALFLVNRPKDVIIPEVIIYPRSQIEQF